MDELCRLYLGDNVEQLRQHVENDSVNLTVTSPPYDNLRNYKGFTFDCDSLIQELYRVTKPGGVVMWNVADGTVNGSETLTSFRHAIKFVEAGFLLHDTMIYEKATFLTHQAIVITKFLNIYVCFCQG
jgi:site-specific DNA-methyltransferase (adenine-specific)